MKILGMFEFFVVLLGFSLLGRFVCLGLGFANSVSHFCSSIINSDTAEGQEMSHLYNSTSSAKV